MEDYNNNTNNHFKRLERFYDGQAFSALFSFLLSGLIYFYYRKNNGFEQHMWLAFHAVTSIIRYGFVYSFKKVKNNQAAMTHETVYSVVIGLTAMGWGYSVYTFYPLSQDYSLALPVIFPLSVLIGGLTKMNLSKKTGYAYIFGVITVFTSYFLWNWSDVSYIMLIAGIMFGGFLTSAASKNYSNYLRLQEALEAQEENVKQLKSTLELEKELSLQKTISLQSSKLASLGEMAGGVAHEINNPLAIVKLSTETLLRRVVRGKADDESIIKTLQTVSQTVDRIARIVKGLLQFARQDDSVKKEKTQIQKIIRETLVLSNEKFSSYGVEIKKKMGDDIDVYANSIAISQVILNLINNSFYHIKNQENPWIEIKVVENDKKKVQVFITDSGENILEDIQEKLFDPFFTTKPIGKGTGLGLSVSKGILNDHSGDLCYKSGEHPCFVLTIPVFQNFMVVDDEPNKEEEDNNSDEAA